MVTDDFKNKVYLATYKGNKNFKEFLSSLLPYAKLIDNKTIEYHYGLMNRKVWYIKVLNNDIIISNDRVMLDKIKLKKSETLYQKIIISNIRGLSKELRNLAKLDDYNYVYRKFAKTYLKNYMTIKSFTIKINVKNKNKFEFKTKIIF